MCCSAASSRSRRWWSYSINCGHRLISTSRRELDLSPCINISKSSPPAPSTTYIPARRPPDGERSRTPCSAWVTPTTRSGPRGSRADMTMRLGPQPRSCSRRSSRHLHRMVGHDTLAHAIPYSESHGASHVGWRRSRLPPRIGRVTSCRRVRHRHRRQRALRDSGRRGVGRMRPGRPRRTIGARVRRRGHGVGLCRGRGDGR